MLCLSRRELGQNLYANNWQPLNVTYDIKRWYDEGVWYDIDTDTCSGPQCGHYTQVCLGLLYVLANKKNIAFDLQNKMHDPIEKHLGGGIS